MKKDQFKRIIKLLVPQIDVDKIKFGKTYYKAYLYIVPFTFNNEDYFLRMYMVDSYAEVCKGTVHSEEVTLINSDDYNNRELLQLIQGE